MMSDGTVTLAASRSAPAVDHREPRSGHGAGLLGREACEFRAGLGPPVGERAQPLLPLPLEPLQFVVFPEFLASHPRDAFALAAERLALFGKPARQILDFLDQEPVEEAIACRYLYRVEEVGKGLRGKENLDRLQRTPLVDVPQPLVQDDASGRESVAVSSMSRVIAVSWSVSTRNWTSNSPSRLAEAAICRSIFTSSAESPLTWPAMPASSLRSRSRSPRMSSRRLWLSSSWRRRSGGSWAEAGRTAPDATPGEHDEDRPGSEPSPGPTRRGRARRTGADSPRVARDHRRAPLRDVRRGRRPAARGGKPPRRRR